MPQIEVSEQQIVDALDRLSLNGSELSTLSWDFTTAVGQ